MSNRKTLTKEQRQQVYEKYNGHCAYCGCELEYKDMQVDHLIPLRNWDGSKTEDELWHMNNLMPSCRLCNHYKRGNSLEIFREQIEKIPFKLNRDNYIYKVGVKYGIIMPKECKILFYFEKLYEEKKFKEIYNINDKDKIIEEIAKFITCENSQWIGTATRLITDAKIETKPNVLMRILNENSMLLLDKFGIKIEKKRNHDKRLLKLEFIRNKSDEKENNIISVKGIFEIPKATNEEISNMTTGEKIKYYRKQKRLSQTELAKKIDCSRGYIWEIENNKHKLNSSKGINTVQKIANALDISVIQLYDLEIKNPTTPFILPDEEIGNMTIGEKIKYYREQKGLLQRDLAKLCEINYSSLSSYETNKTIPTYRVITKIATALNIRVEDIIDISQITDEEISNMSIGEKIKYYREQKGFSQMELGLYSGINNKTISSYETNRQSPHSNNLTKIANALDISITQLYDLKIENQQYISDEEINSMSIGEILRYYRNLNKLTQDELAKLCGISGEIIYSYETEKVEPFRITVNKIAQILDVNINQFIGTKQFVDDKGLEKMTFGEKIRYCREKKGLSQSDLAQAIGVSRSTIYDIEKDKRSINISSRRNKSILFNIKKILNIDINMLIEGR